MTTATSWETRHIRQEFFDLFTDLGAETAAKRGYHDMHEAAQQAVISDFADNLRAMIEELEMPADSTPFAQSVMQEYLREVDWYELAEEFIKAGE